MRPIKLPLRAVAKELYEQTGSRQTELLEHLREGNLEAVVVLPKLNPTPHPVPRSVWINMRNKDFKVRYKTDGHWHAPPFAIPIDFVIKSALADLSRALDASFHKDPTQLDCKALQQWAPDAPATPPPTDEGWFQLHAKLVLAIKAFGALRGDREQVYVTRVEYEKFFRELAAVPKGPGGRRPLPSDTFWLELIFRLKPVRPASHQKALIHDLKGVLAKDNPSESWVKQRVQDVYRRMGWQEESGQ